MASVQKGRGRDYFPLPLTLLTPVTQTIVLRETLRDSRASELREGVTITPRDKRRHAEGREKDTVLSFSSLPTASRLSRVGSFSRAHVVIFL